MNSYFRTRWWRRLKDCGFFDSIPLWAVTLICSLVITILSFVIILSVYARFFKRLLEAIALVPLQNSPCGELLRSKIGKKLLEILCGGMSEGAIYILACLHHFFGIAVVSAGSESRCGACWYGVSYVGELDFQYAGTCGSSKACGSHSKGNDGALERSNKWK